jgi:predicted  nucleic acid-binding Zn-ribbon protein
MAEPVPAGSDVSAGTYECTNCGKQIDVGSTKHLPPCPSCGNGKWQTVTGGDAVDDPYPDGDGQRRNKSGSSSSPIQWIKDKAGLSRE